MSAIDLNPDDLHDALVLLRLCHAEDINTFPTGYSARMCATLERAFGSSGDDTPMERSLDIYEDEIKSLRMDTLELLLGSQRDRVVHGDVVTNINRLARVALNILSVCRSSAADHGRSPLPSVDDTKHEGGEKP